MTTASRRLWPLALLVCLLVAATLCVRADDDEELSRADIVQTTKYDMTKALAQYGAFPAQATGKHSKNAYVIIHYEGTPKDDLYVLGVRVLLRSIRKTGTKEDLVCLIADNVRQSTRDYFAAEGCILKTVPNIPNPYKETQQLRRTYKPRFEFTFNKLYVWNLLEYERVMYLDADNVFLNNIDDLFYCGEFCVVFFNPSFFHTGMMVIKPDAKVFRRLLTNLLTFKTFSYDGADQGFLIAEFPQLEWDPMFEPSVVFADPSNPKRYELPRMRFPLEYNYNSVYWYPYYSFDYWRRANLPFSKNPIPVGSIAYCIGPELKPWNWFPYLFFSTIWHWNTVRMELGDSYVAYLTAHYSLLLAIGLAIWSLTRYARAQRWFVSVNAVGRRLVTSVPTTFAVLVNAVTFYLVLRFWWIFIPQIIPPVHAWPLAITTMFVFMYSALNLFAVVVAPPAPASGSSSSSSTASTAVATSSGAATSSSVTACAMAAASSPVVSLAVGSSVFGSSWSRAASLGFHLDWFAVVLAPAPGAGATAAGSGAWDTADGDVAGLGVAGGIALVPLGTGAGAGAGTGTGTGAGAPGGPDSLSGDGFDDPDWSDAGAGGGLSSDVDSGAGGLTASERQPMIAGAGAVGIRRAAAGRAAAAAGLIGAAGAGGSAGSGAAGGMTQAAALAAVATSPTLRVASVAASLRNGVSVKVLVFPLLMALMGSYFCMIATWHTHFVYKLIFFVGSILASVLSFTYLFIRVASISVLKPGAVQVHVLTAGPAGPPATGDVAPKTLEV